MKQNLSKNHLNSVDSQNLSSNLQSTSQTTELEPTKPEAHTYGQILKSSAIIGGSSIINIVIGIVRTKFMALLLGPSGVGLMGLYSSILDLTLSIAGMGINSSGVRQIAEAVGTDDKEKIAKTAQVLRRTSIFLGLLGAVVLFGFSTQLSIITFGNDQHANGVALLSIAVLFSLLSAGQGALIQGLRRIADLAKMNILGTLFGTLISITTVYYLREDGIALSIVFTAAMALCTSWWYRRKIDLQHFPVTSSFLAHEQASLLKLGLALMSSGLMMTGATYVVRMIIVRNIGFDAAGLYQSAWALGGLYVGFILQAMGTDFYPRLVVVSKDDDECNRIVNEQAYVSLLLAGPGVIATLTYAPLVIALFYTSKFEGAVEILRWLCLGMALRIVSWPLGYIIVAKSVQNIFILAELAWTLVYLSLAWICIDTFKLNGAGIAFFGSYIFHCVLIYLIVRRLVGFRWSAINIRAGLLFFTMNAIVFLGNFILSSHAAIAFGTVIFLLSSVYSIQGLLNIISHDLIPRPILKLLRSFQQITHAFTKHIANTTRQNLFKHLLTLFFIFCLFYISIPNIDGLNILKTITHFVKYVWGYLSLTETH